MIGIDLLPWQRWLLIHALELLPDGNFRFRNVVVLVARQNGKSTLSLVMALWFMYVYGFELVIGTAQDLDLAEEIWESAVELAQDNPELAAEISRVVRVNGKKALELTGGQRYKVKAANRRAGRGLSGDLILLDELREHQTWEAWSAITKTTMARAVAMIWSMSNAGDATSVVLRHLRKMGHIALGDPDGIAEDPGVEKPPADIDIDADIDDDDFIDEEDTEPDSLGIFEWSAPPGSDLWDRDAWAQANPAMNHTLPERNIVDACRTDPEWVFRVEVMCQWTDGSLEGPFPPGSWEAGTDVESEIPEGNRVVYGIDTSADRTHTHIGVAGYRDDGVPHGEIVATRAGTDWPFTWFEERASEDNPMTVVLQAKGAPVSSLADDLRAIEHLTVVEWGGPDLGNGTQKMYDLVKASKLAEIDGAAPRREGFAHLPQPVLDIAAATAVPKILSDGGMAWDRRKSPTDIAPLVAVTAAVWYLLQREEPAEKSVYEERGMVSID